jgi:hypothetical protein
MILSSVGFVRRKITVKVYMGLVPISPKTRPKDLTMPVAVSFLIRRSTPLLSRFELHVTCISCYLRA